MRYSRHFKPRHALTRLVSHAHSQELFVFKSHASLIFTSATRASECALGLYNALMEAHKRDLGRIAWLLFLEASTAADNLDGAESIDGTLAHAILAIAERGSHLALSLHGLLVRDQDAHGALAAWTIYEEARVSAERMGDDMGVEVELPA